MQERLQKILARGGLASRRAAEQWIAEGRVRVNGRVVSELGAKADPRADKIEVDGKRVIAEAFVYAVLHKPRGVVSTLQDPEGRPTVREYIAQLGARVYPVGRLDFATSGVLLVTNDGAFADGLLHPKRAVPKTYVVKVNGVMQPADLERWEHGVRLEDGAVTAPAKATLLRHEEGDKTWFELTISEGRNQQIRRMGVATGFSVMRLSRVSFAGITNEGLRPGMLRMLTVDELRTLRDAYGVPKKVRAPQPLEDAPRVRAPRPRNEGARGKGPAENRAEYTKDAEPREWRGRREEQGTMAERPRRGEQGTSRGARRGEQGTMERPYRSASGDRAERGGPERGAGRSGGRTAREGSERGAGARAERGGSERGAGRSGGRTAREGSERGAGRSGGRAERGVGARSGGRAERGGPERGAGRAERGGPERGAGRAERGGSERGAGRAERGAGGRAEHAGRSGGRAERAGSRPERGADRTERGGSERGAGSRSGDRAARGAGGRSGRRRS